MHLRVLVSLYWFLVSLGFMYVNCVCDLKKLTKNRIVPNTLSGTIVKELEVSYSDRRVKCGEEIKRSTTRNPPQVKFAADDNNLYTLLMFDPDAPTPQNPIYANYLHWYIVNIPGAKIEQGSVLAGYLPPNPPSYSDAHRYGFIVFQQSSFDSSPLYTGSRTNFVLSDAIKKKKSGSDLAGNFFYVRH